VWKTPAIWRLFLGTVSPIDRLVHGMFCRQAPLDAHRPRCLGLCADPRPRPSPLPRLCGNVTLGYVRVFRFTCAPFGFARAFRSACSLLRAAPANGPPRTTSVDRPPKALSCRERASVAPPPVALFSEAERGRCQPIWRLVLILLSSG
jgi:hypothetical protein